MCAFLLDDYNRVVLDLQPGIPDSDYVNGSYVDVRHVVTLIVSLKVGASVMINRLCSLRVEYPQTKCLRGDSGTEREDRFRLLASRLASSRQLHRHAHQNFRFYQSIR